VYGALRHTFLDITEILLNVALSSTSPTISPQNYEINKLGPFDEDQW
jgi:hypothetical protein